MKYITYFFMAIASAVLVILLSLSACSPTPKVATSPSMVMEQPKEHPQAAPDHPAQSQAPHQTG